MTDSPGTRNPRPRAQQFARQFAPRLGLLLALLLVGHLLLPARAGAEPVEWKTGEAFERQLDAPAGEIRWAGTPLRDALTSLSRANGICIFLDRRVDPGQAVTFQSEPESLLEAIESLTGNLGLGIALIGPVVYVAPSQQEAMIQTVALERFQSASRWAPPLGQNLRRVAKLDWPHLAEPREILKSLQSDLQRPLNGLDKAVPHDLWAAGDLPPLPLAHRLSIVLAGFGLTYDAPSDGRLLSLVAMPQNADLKVRHPVRKATSAKLKLIQRKFPDVELKKISEDAVEVQADYETQYWVQRVFRKSPTGAASNVVTSPTEKRYDLRVEGLFGDVIKQLAAQTGYQLTIHPSIKAELNQPVKLEARQATLPEIFQDLAQKKGLACKVEGKQVTVTPGPAEPGDE